jgi:hypothetical protein
VVVDVISDEAAKYTARDFFTQRSKIQNNMENTLKDRVATLTYHEVVFFQLRHLSLPDAYEREIENTEVKGQDILKASAELERAYVKFNTTIIIAALEVNATKETAKGDAGKIIHDSRAYQTTILKVSEAQGEAIRDMKSTLSFSNTNIIEYLRTNLIKDYTTGRVAMQMEL